MINQNDLPKWLLSLDVEDINFIKKFVVASGSLKEIAKVYKITYPTLRLRLDKLIEKIKISDTEDDSFVLHIKQMAVDNKLSYESAKEIIELYRKNK